MDERSRRILIVVLVIAGVLMVCLAAAVLSVLLGITAEPETVIEQILRTISGQ